LQEKYGGIKEASDRMDHRTFIENLTDRLQERHNFKRARGKHNWVALESNAPDVFYAFGFETRRGELVNAALVIDSSDKDWNKKLYDALEEEEDSLSSEFVEELKWERRNDQRQSRISIFRQGSIKDDWQTLKDIEEWAINRLLKFREVFGPRLDNIG
jgi:Domain of unknown function (DUF4268)